MKELFEEKRKNAEKEIESKKTSAGGGPTKADMEARKAKLLEQRDKLRKQKEDKRREELDVFNQKTETKSELFSEL